MKNCVKPQEDFKEVLAHSCDVRGGEVKTFHGIHHVL